MRNVIKINIFNSIIFSLCFILVGSSDGRDISDKRKCADPKCSEPISSGYAQVNYFSNRKYGLNMKMGAAVTVFSKEAGNNPSLWGVEVNGKRGYVPETLILEKKIFKKNDDLIHIVPTEPFMKGGDSEIQSVADKEPSSTENILIKSDVEKVMNDPHNMLTSFFFPGSLAENTIETDLKDKIDPKKVEAIVIDGTTIYHDSNDNSYADDTVHVDLSPKPDESADFKSENAVETSVDNELKSEVSISTENNFTIDSLNNSLVANDDSSNSQVPNNVADTDTAETEYSDKNNYAAPENSSSGVKDSSNSFQVHYDVGNSLTKTEISDENNSVLSEKLSDFNDKVESKEKDTFETTGSDNTHVKDKDFEEDEEEEEEEDDDDGGEGGIDEEDDESIDEGDDEKKDIANPLKENNIENKVSFDSIDLIDESINKNGVISIGSDITDIPEQLRINPSEEKTSIDNSEIKKGIDEQSEQQKTSQPPDDLLKVAGLSHKGDDNITIDLPEISQNNDVLKESELSGEQVVNDQQLLKKSDGSNAESVKVIIDNYDDNSSKVSEQTAVSDNEISKKESENESDRDQQLNISDLNETGPEVSSVSENLFSKPLDDVLNKNEVSDGFTTEQSEEITEAKQHSADSLEFKDLNNKIDSSTEIYSGSLEEPAFSAAEVPFSGGIVISTDKPHIDLHLSDHPYQQEDSSKEDFSLLEEATDKKDVTVGGEKLFKEDVLMTEKSSVDDNSAQEQPVHEIDPSIDKKTSFQGQDLTKIFETETNIDPTSSVIQVPQETSPEKEIALTEETSDISDNESWFNFNFVSITNLFSSTVEPNPEVTDEIDGQSTETEHSVSNKIPDFSSEQKQYCLANENGEHSCKQFKNIKEENLSTTDDKTEEDSWDVIKELLSASQSVSLSMDSVIYLVVTAVTVILFSLGYYYIENHKNDSALVSKINTLERDLLVVKKEATVLQERLQCAESQVTVSHDSVTEFNEQLAALTQELEETKAAKMELEEQYLILKKEFDAAAESGLEMHRLLTESLSTQDGVQMLLKTVENLREKIERQDIEIKEHKQLLSEKSEEIDKLNVEIQANQETRKALQEKLTSLRREKEEEILQLKDSNRTLSTQLGDVMEGKSLMEMKLSNDISKLRLLLEDTQTMLADREGEIDALKEAIAKLNKHVKEEDLEALYDTARVNSKLSIVEKERDSYKEKFIEEEGARKLLEDHVQMTRQEVKSLKENYETAEKEKIEALTKLQVLSNYFKEKESQLQKELGLQESLWLQKQSDDHTIYEQMKSLREENEKYKMQNESLKKEICESESAFKIQIANAEQKAHDNWLASRQLERRLKETQNEATQLRNRLTLVEKNATNSSSDDLKQNLSYGVGETNGDPSSPPPTLPMFSPTTSPPFMMFGGPLPPPPPPPNSEFLPPPPPPPLGYPEGRPAPVGRISSPPLDQSFSPPPPPVPYFYETAVYGSHHSPSPPPHRPKPKPIREIGMEQKDRVSPPRHSEQQERHSRRSKR